MNEHEALVFLVALGLLLGVARILGELGQRILGAPAIVGGVVTGLLLGETVLGRVAPDAYAWLWNARVADTMLGGYAMLGALLVLVLAGIEVDLSVVRRRVQSALPLVVLAILFPLASGFALGFALPASDLVAADRRLVFAVVLGFALSLSALPVIARRLVDLGLFKTDLGLLIMTAATVGDLLGWLAFSVILGPLSAKELDVGRVAVSALVAVAFAALCLFVGRRVLDRLLARIEGDRDEAPGRVLWFVVVVALAGAALTQAIGVHAVLGGFFVGVVVGDSPRTRVRTRAAVRDLVTNVFAPVFFAWVVARVDFVRAFDARLVLLVLSVASLSKVLGSSLGARWSGLKWREAGAVGIALNARGSMEVILAGLTLRTGLIGEPMFVALVVMALATSVASGPLTKRLLYRSREEDVVALLRGGVFVPTLEATLPMMAIEELVAALTAELGPLAEKARIAVIERELVGSTGLGDEVAIPHAAVPGLDHPLLALGRAPHGIDFDALDGKTAKLVFLLLVPPKAYEEEVQILASIARTVFDARARAEVLGARGLEDVLVVLGASAKRMAATTKRGSGARAVA